LSLLRRGDDAIAPVVRRRVALVALDRERVVVGPKPLAGDEERRPHRDDQPGERLAVWARRRTGRRPAERPDPRRDVEGLGKGVPRPAALPRPELVRPRRLPLVETLDDRLVRIDDLVARSLEDVEELAAGRCDLPGAERPGVIGREPLALGRDPVRDPELVRDRRLDRLGVARDDPAYLVGDDPRLPLPVVTRLEPAAESAEPARLADPLRLTPRTPDQTPEDPDPRVAEEPLEHRAVAAPEDHRAPLPDRSARGRRRRAVRGERAFAVGIASRLVSRHRHLRRHARRDHVERDQVDVALVARE